MSEPFKSTEEALNSIKGVAPKAGYEWILATNKSNENDDRAVVFQAPIIYQPKYSR